MKLAIVILSLATVIQSGFGTSGELRLPARPNDALVGSKIAEELSSLPLQAREDRIWKEVTMGNVPEFLRHFCSVPVTATVEGKEVGGHIFALPDYLAVGSNEDYLFVPVTPYTAQRIADRLDCTLPTPKMVDDIYQSADVKLAPCPIPPSAAMTTVPVFLGHTKSVNAQRSVTLNQFPLGALVAGDKKDIVICATLSDTPGKVAIYGWHTAVGKPIQPLFLGHVATWADYSHGTRLISNTMDIDGHPMPVAKVLADPKLSALVSNEGPIAISRYTFEVFPHPDDPTIHLPLDERLQTFFPVKGVRVVIDEPTELKTRIRLVLFALPNGNTIEQTFGRRKQPGDDWHYDIQHIGAQTRFVRRTVKDESVVVAYIEANNHAWPQWLHGQDANVTETIVNSIISRYSNVDLHVAIDSHSGGGAFEFAYINSVSEIPAPIDRIAFLDSEYNYDATNHEAKIAKWLRADNHYLCAIAYDDASARYKGKPFVSAQGGTWGRTHAILSDLGRDFPITRTNSTDPERYEGLSGRIVFLLKENPSAEVFHTVQVERNGFIESLLSGTSYEEKGYTYFGKRAYSKLIHD